MKTLSIDIETYSSVSLTESGVYAYAESPDFTILLLAYGFDDEAVQVIDLAQEEEIPQVLHEALTDDDVIKTAYNANFERTCLARYLGKPMPPNQWRCTAVHASMLGLPGNLKGVCEALGLGEEETKSKTGRALIQYFSVPCKPTAKNGQRVRNLPEHDLEKWQLFKDYCKQDVVAEKAIKDRLSTFPVAQSEQELWELDQKINDGGILIDTQLVDNIIAYDQTYQEKLMEEAKTLTGLTNPNSVAQLKNWLREQAINPTGLTKAKVEELLETTTGTIKRVLELRKAMSKTSTKKYEAMKRALCPDNRVRGTLQFYGANRSGRWAGRLLQVHNLPQNKVPDIELARELVKEGDFGTLEMLFGETPFIFSQLVRTAIIANHSFIISDFSAIEARVVAWLADEKWVLETFKGDGKLYERTASRMFNVPIEKIIKGQPEYELRQKGKVATLACIAEDELVLTDHGLIPIQDVKSYHLLWDGLEWVKHEGVVFNGEREVIEYDGLRATKDHLIWIEGLQEPIQFGEAAASGAHLLQTGNGRQAIWMGKDNRARKKMVKDLESLSCFNTMHGVRKCAMDLARQLEKWKIERLSTVFKIKKSTCMARQKVNICKATLRKHKKFSISFVWSKRHRVPIQFCNGSRIMGFTKFGEHITRFGIRSDRFQWSLRSGKFEIRRQKGKCREQKNNRVVGMGSEILAICKTCCDEDVIRGNDKRNNNCFGRVSGRGKKKKLGTNSSKACVYDIRNAGPRHRFTVSGKLVHNCAYGGSVGALTSMGALKMGLVEEELSDIVRAWRKANPNIVCLWYDTEKAVKDALDTGWQVPITKGVSAELEQGTLFIALPSGRRLAYAEVDIEDNQITYMGIDQQTKKWTKVRTYGAKLVENITQAIARDCLAEAMKRIDRAGYGICLHVHDEVIIDTDKDAMGEIAEIMGEDIEWAPGLPLRGDTYSTKIYRKD